MQYQFEDIQESTEVFMFVDVLTGREVRVLEFVFVLRSSDRWSSDQHNRRSPRGIRLSFRSKVCCSCLLKACGFTRRRHYPTGHAICVIRGIVSIWVYKCDDAQWIDKWKVFVLKVMCKVYANVHISVSISIYQTRAHVFECVQICKVGRLLECYVTNLRASLDVLDLEPSCNVPK